MKITVLDYVIDEVYFTKMRQLENPNDFNDAVSKLSAFVENPELVKKILKEVDERIKTR